MCEQSKAAYGRIPTMKGIEMAGDQHLSVKYTAIFLPAPIME